MAEEGYVGIWGGFAAAQRVGIDRVVLNGKEKAIALKPLSKVSVFYVVASL